MAWHRLVVVAGLVAAVAGEAVAVEPSPVEALRARFPRGIPWDVELSTNGESRGKLQMLITYSQASSCLGDMADGVRVEFTRKELSPPLSIGAYGVARFAGDKVKIDLTGGVCDAYLLMNGVVAPDGSSTGDVYTFGPSGGHDVATYHAIVK